MLNELKDYKNLDVYVTGSNSKMLSKDISTEFRGRSSQIQVYPLSFSEFNAAVGGDKRDNFDRYMIYGGLPYLLHLKNDEQYKQYLSNLFDEVYIKDIVERNKMENIIYNELLVRGYSVDVGVVVDRRNRSNTQKEIDFVVNKDDKRVYIQSAWQMTSDEKISSELDSLKLAKDFFSKIIIQNDIPSHYIDEDGIIHCNLIEFLLKPELISL